MGENCLILWWCYSSRYIYIYLCLLIRKWANVHKVKRATESEAREQHTHIPMCGEWWEWRNLHYNEETWRESSTMRDKHWNRIEKWKFLGAPMMQLNFEFKPSTQNAIVYVCVLCDQCVHFWGFILRTILIKHFRYVLNAYNNTHSNSLTHSLVFQR